MFDIDNTVLLTCSLVFVRIGALLFTMPLFGEANIPVLIKIVTTLSLTIGLYPILPPAWLPSADLSILAFVGYVLRELFLGLAIGFVSRMMFEGVVMAASFVGYQMGFGTSSLMMPGSEFQSNSFTALHRIIVVLIFLILGFHHLFINAIVETFQVIPAGKATFNPKLGELIITSTAKIFPIAIQFASPVLVSLLFAMAALGLVARTVPQLNVFTMSFPLSFYTGLTIYVISTPFFPAWLREHYINIGKDIFSTIQLAKP